VQKHPQVTRAHHYSLAWQGGWRGNLENGGKTGEIQKFNFYEF